MTREIKITVRLVPRIRRGRQDYWGFCTQESRGRFTILVEEGSPTLATLGVLYHELTHALVGWAGREGVRAAEEEAACDRVERAGMAALRAMWKRAWRKNDRAQKV